MKKILLILAMMLATVGMMVAQDVYSAGYYTSIDGQVKAAVYKNDIKLYESAYGASNDNYSTSVVVSHVNGDVYWTRCNDYYGDVFKNQNIFLNQPYGVNSFIHDLEWTPEMSLTNGNPEYCLHAAGYRVGSDGKKYAAVWRGSNVTPVYSPDFEDGYQSEAYGVVGTKETTGGFWFYSCGYYSTNEAGDHYRACVWKNNTLYYTLSTNNFSKAYGIDFYDNHIYTVGTEKINDHIVTKVWRDNMELYTLTSDANDSRGWKIKVDGGDVWVCGWETGALKTWKNGQLVYSFSGSNNRGIYIDSEGVYNAIVSSSQGKIYKNGNLLYNINNCEYLYDVCVGPVECEDEDVRTLPYFEGFEMGETDWTCWTTLDVDKNNGTDIGEYASYWHRNGYYEASGEYSAAHGYGPTDKPQEGWLISPKLYLQPGRDWTRLTFETREGAANDMEYEGVWISTTTTDPSSFTEVWSQDSPSDSWKEVEINLSDYQGQVVYIAFKYTGTYGHLWYIDDVSVEESWVPCSVNGVPYTYDFDNWDLTSSCWYVLDSDMSGGQKNWQFNSSYGCAYHPWGQTGMPQEGWLFSEYVNLPTGGNYTLTFNTVNASSGADMRNSVWIAIDPDVYDNPNPSDFNEIWVESSYNGSWAERTIDLTAYAGHVVSIAFKYEGTYAHAWYVDDFSITAGVAQYNINVEANNAAWGTVTGGGTYEQGETVTITATPNSGYVFLKWIKDGYEVYTGESYTFTVTENATFTAVFGEPAVTYFDITTNANPAAGGTVTGDGTYAQGTEVTLVATANTGWHFVRWQDDNTDNPRTITVNATETYTAYFEADIYAIVVTASPEEGGNVTGGGTYPYGSVVALNAIPKTDYEFLNWNDGVTTAARSVTVTGNATYVAHFVSTSTTVYSVTALSNDPTLGEVTGGGTYPEGAEVTLTANPFGDAVFTKWNDDNTDNPRTITVTGNATYTAYFEVPAMYTITVTSMNPEMGSVSGGGNFPMGAEVTIQANPFGGYYFDGWSDNNYDNPRTITVTGDATYSAKFSAQQSQTFTLTTTCNPMHGYVDGSGNYPAGTEVTVTAVAYEGYEFDHWNDNDVQNPRTVTVNSNMTLVAFFKATGVGENGEPEVSLYPNPAKESVRLKGIEANSEVVFYNVLGMMVKTVNANAEQEINVSDLAAGVYTVRCGHQVLRFVKE